ncbi:transglycosylase SLT domain-containing protein [Bacillus sp. DX1.1]|uniref:transglycosylase SLT domain-containing protein n=1 Tax=unclassified Bacillus (in: firmicutes) TaxID=185979 RepID=UPI002570EBA0|nr:MULTISPECIES: transglycosylase SLT domain-containing protein [unclassified Bacillus (in: firmicutes)]MDM5153020.1 transglycosylase SLT domain-containing protein [Bacillus sp. DX1.1]WJE81996.1 transglycosylase SLT domain-containing protein [Bacillus sp. DX3.1]
MKKFFVGFLVVLGMYLFFRGESEGMEKSTNQMSYVDSEEAKQMKQIIIEEAKKVNLPEWIPLTIAEHESRLNPRSVGDKGTSFGLFQLHRGGGLAPDHLTDEQLKDPRTNAGIAMPHLMKGYKRGLQKGLTDLDLLKYIANTSGWPGNLGTEWTDKNMKYNVGLENVYYRNKGLVKE